MYKTFFSSASFQETILDLTNREESFLQENSILNTSELQRSSKDWQLSKITEKFFDYCIGSNIIFSTNWFFTRDGLLVCTDWL